MDERRAWTERVRQATERGLFVLTSQPIVNLETGRRLSTRSCCGCGDDGGGLVEPGAFLATAERFGLIGGIDRWVTQQAVRLIAAHNAEGRELTLEVNLSGQTMGDARFPDEVQAELTSSGIDPASLIFEVTETAAVADMDHARLFAKSLARVGCRFALDDFGAGYASFYYLKHLPISYLKIDGEFVKELPHSRTDQLIVRAMVESARARHQDRSPSSSGRPDDHGHGARAGRRLRPGLPPGEARAGLGAQGRVIRSSGIRNDS